MQYHIAALFIFFLTKKRTVAAAAKKVKPTWRGKFNAGHPMLPHTSQRTEKMGVL